MTTTIHQPLRSLLSGLIDYAGLFPPAKLAMQPAIDSFARDVRSEHAWMLGRFICTVSRLPEFSEKAAIQLPGTYATSGYREHADDLEPWKLSVVADRPLEECLDEIDAFNEHHSHEDHGLAKVDMIEMRVSEVGEIDEALDELPEDLFPFFEFPIAGDPRGFVAALAGDSAAAKIRCGGVTPDLIPPTEAVARFIEACVVGGVPFKATAGLHHPIRAEYPLSYEPDAPRGRMHGFLNVFLAAALARHAGLRGEELIAVLDESEPSAFESTAQGVRWRGRTLDAVQLAHTRERTALGYGSCSFTEPIDDLRALGML